jgi:transposase
VQEIAEIERVIAKEALASPEIRRLMTIPGMNVITASAFMAAIGDVGRFGDRKKLVGYLGLDPRVRESGTTAASRARISKQGSSSGRYALVEASWSVILAPARCTPSLSASAPAEDIRRRSSQWRESWPAFAGAC